MGTIKFRVVGEIDPNDERVITSTQREITIQTIAGARHELSPPIYTDEEGDLVWVKLDGERYEHRPSGKIYRSR